MNLLRNPNTRFGLIAVLLCLGLLLPLYFRDAPVRAMAGDAPKNTDQKATAEAPTASPAATATAPNDSTSANRTNSVAGAVSSATTTNKAEKAQAGVVVTAAVPPGSNAPNVAAQAGSATGPARAAGATPPPSGASSPDPAAPPTGGGNPPKAEVEPTPPTDEVSLSFQGANIDMIVQWLAKTTGKSVVKHPRVQCQLNIVSSKKITQREAVNLVYRALALEGFTAIESSKSIMIVPEGQEPKMSPLIVDAANGEIPEGRQKLLKIFQLKNTSASEVRDRVRAVLSDKATVEVNDAANQMMVTDYNENLRLLSELIKELDVTPVTDNVMEIFPLKYLQAEEMANLLGMILNAQPAKPSAARPPSSPPPSPPPSPMPGGLSRRLPPGVEISGGPSGPPPSSSPPPSSAPSSSSSGSTGSTSLIRFWPDRTSNRLIVTAPKGRLPEIKRLIDLLDTEKSEDVAVRVITLKNVSAEDLVKEVAPLYQKIKNKSDKDVIEISANTRSNSLIILSSEANFKAIEKLVSALDTEEAQEKVMQSFALRNADAEDVAKQLQELNQDESSRYPYYYFYGSSQSKNTKKFSVVADRRRNTVIVQAPPNAMEGIANMVKSLDEPVADSNLAPKIIHLKYVSATDIEDVLNELFLKKTQQRSYYYFFDDYPQETADKNVGRLYGKVRITSEPYSNCLIITANSVENLGVVEEVVNKLDRPSEEGETTLRVPLNFAKAINVANSINILFAKAASPALRQGNQQGQQQNQGNYQQQNQQNNATANSFELEQKAEEETYYPWLGGQQENIRGSDNRNATRPVSDLVGRVRIVPDKRGNAVLVTCNVHFFPQIKRLIEQLDEPTPQVLIESKILEISSEGLDQLGVRWSPNGAQTFTGDDFDDSVMPSVGATYSKVFAGSALANSLKTGVLNGKVNLDLLIQALRRDTHATVLAAPQLNIADNEMGKLFVGSRVPLLQNSILNTAGLGGRNDAYQYQDVGVILDVTPHINTAEEVDLRIRAESSSLNANQTVLGGPIINTRNFRTELVVRNGQTVVLGGIIQREQQKIVRKVPLLGSIPVLGWAFKKKDQVSRETELMVFLTPKVTRTPEQAKSLLEDVQQKTPLIKQWLQQEQMQKEKQPPLRSSDG